MHDRKSEPSSSTTTLDELPRLNDHRDSSRPELRRIVRVGAAARDQHSSRKWDQLNCRHSVATIPMMRRYEVTLFFSEGVGALC
jgi:hypothetical protein